MQFLERRIPPPVVFLVSCWLMARLTPPGSSLPLPSWVCWFLIGLYLSMALILIRPALTRFRQAGTPSNPVKVDGATSLVVEGPYRWTRNPMYLGLIFILLAWAVYLGSLRAFVGPLIAALYLNRFQIIPEERALLTRFGSEYEQYCQRVRRWF